MRAKSVLVVDDEPLARQRLLRLLAQCDGFSVCAEATNGRQAVELVERYQPDIVLLDVRMPELDGLAVARRWSQQLSPPAVIFCTAYGEHALEAFQSSAAGYLLKPLKLERLRTMLARASQLTRAQLSGVAVPGRRRHIAIKKRLGVELVAVAAVCYFIADQKYVTLGYGGREVLIDGSLKALETEFGELFQRVHRNALVSIAHIEALERDESGCYRVRLRGVKLKPEVSRRHLAFIRELMQVL